MNDSFVMITEEAFDEKVKAVLRDQAKRLADSTDDGGLALVIGVVLSCSMGDLKKSLFED